MATNKTQPTDVDPASFVATVDDPRRRADAEVMLELMARVTGEEPRMWGPSMVGFGEFHYRSDAGREGDWMTVGFAPRKAATVVYLLDGLDAHEAALETLGPYSRGKGCLYIKRLDDVDLEVLEGMVRQAHSTLTS